MAKTEKRSSSATRLPSHVDRALKAADGKKAVDLVVLDLRKAAGFTDFFVICSGTNSRQVRAIADGVMEALAADGSKPAHIECRNHWPDFIAHLLVMRSSLPLRGFL